MFKTSWWCHGVLANIGQNVLPSEQILDQKWPLPDVVRTKWSNLWEMPDVQSVRTKFCGSNGGPNKAVHRWFAPVTSVIALCGYITEPMYRLKHRFRDPVRLRPVLFNHGHQPNKAILDGSFAPLILQFLPAAGCLIITSLHLAENSRRQGFGRNPLIEARFTSNFTWVPNFQYLGICPLLYLIHSCFFYICANQVILLKLRLQS